MNELLHLPIRLITETTFDLNNAKREKSCVVQVASSFCFQPVASTMLAARSACFVPQAAATAIGCLNFTNAVYDNHLFHWCDAGELYCYNIFVHLARVSPRSTRHPTPHCTARHLNNVNLYFSRTKRNKEHNKMRTSVHLF